MKIILFGMDRDPSAGRAAVTLLLNGAPILHLFKELADISRLAHSLETKAKVLRFFPMKVKLASVNLRWRSVLASTGLLWGWPRPTGARFSGTSRARSRTMDLSHACTSIAAWLTLHRSASGSRHRQAAAPWHSKSVRRLSCDGCRGGAAGIRTRYPDSS
jgi:hypothetical protein